jgi:hypothetical protein
MGKPLLHGGLDIGSELNQQTDTRSPSLKHSVKGVRLATWGAGGPPAPFLCEPCLSIRKPGGHVLIPATPESARFVSWRRFDVIFRQPRQFVSGYMRAGEDRRPMIFTSYGFFFDPTVVPIFFAIDAMLTLIGTMIAKL